MDLLQSLGEADGDFVCSLRLELELESMLESTGLPELGEEVGASILKLVLAINYVS